MAEEIKEEVAAPMVADVAAAPVVAVVPVAVEPKQDWLASVAMKKVGWALTKILTAKIGGMATAPAAVIALAQFNAITGPYGFTVNVDQALFEKSLPVAIFAGLVWAHDYAKVKTKLPWL